jgi:hypothetical protein
MTHLLNTFELDLVQINNSILRELNQLNKLTVRAQDQGRTQRRGKGATTPPRENYIYDF